MPQPVHLLSLALAGFRNHRATRIEPGMAPLVLLAGPNGAGKTNMLEAASLLAPGRGLRGATLTDMAAAGTSGGFRVAAQLSTDPALPPIDIRTGAAPPAPGRRTLAINGAAAPLATLGEWLSLLWLTPAMDRLFADTASARRRFLDRLVLALDPAHAGHATRYEAAMRARTRLLTADERPDPVWLDALEAQMAEHGARLAAARATAVAALDARLAAEPTGQFPRASLSLAGSGVADLAARLRAGRTIDAAAGRALEGPHRADLLVHHADKDMPAHLASTGEQKALLIAILLAHAGLVADETGRAPLLLLDEAAAHLDPDRRRALLERLPALGGQAWLTGTEMRLFEGADGARYAIADGRADPF